MFCAAVIAGQFELQLFAEDTQDVIRFVDNCTMEIDHVYSDCNFTSSGAILAVDPKLVKGEYFSVKFRDSRFVLLDYSAQMISDTQTSKTSLRYFLCLNYTVQENNSMHRPIKNASLIMRHDGDIKFTAPMSGEREPIYVPIEHSRYRKFTIEVVDNTHFFNSQTFEVVLAVNQTRDVRTIQLDKNTHIAVAVRVSSKNISAGPTNVSLQIGQSKVTIFADASGNALFPVSSFSELKENASYALGIEDQRFKPVFYKGQIETLRWTELVEPHLALTLRYFGQNGGIANAHLSLSVNGAVILKTRTDQQGEGIFLIPLQYKPATSPLKFVVSFRDNKNEYFDAKSTISISENCSSKSFSQTLMSKSNIGMIAGLCVASVALLVTVVVVVLYIRKKKSLNSERQPLTSDDTI